MSSRSGLDRALGRGIEETQRLDLVADELRPHRPLAHRREHVHDPAAQAPLPDLDHGVHALVARGLEPPEEGLALDRARRPSGRTCARGTRPARAAGRRSADGRRDDHDAAPVSDVVAGQRALGRVVPVPAAPRGGLGGRKLQHGRRAARASRLPRKKRVSSAMRCRSGTCRAPCSSAGPARLASRGRPPRELREEPQSPSAWRQGTPRARAACELFERGPPGQDRLRRGDGHTMRRDYGLPFTTAAYEMAPALQVPLASPRAGAARRGVARVYFSSGLGFGATCAR